MIFLIFIATLAFAEEAHVNPPLPRPRPEHRYDNRRAAPFPPNYRSPAPTATFRSNGVNSNCDVYIRPDGTYGPRGLLARAEFLGAGRSSNRVKYFIDSDLPEMNLICPKWRDLNEEQRANFWVWYLMSASFDESACADPDWMVNEAATNTTATGEFQLPEAWEDHRDWRGPGCDTSAERVNGHLMTNPINAIPCIVQILGDGICGSYHNYAQGCTKQLRAPFGSHIYFQEAKTINSDIIPLVKEFPLCGNTPPRG